MSSVNYLNTYDSTNNRNHQSLLTDTTVYNSYKNVYQEIYVSEIKNDRCQQYAQVSFSLMNTCYADAVAPTYVPLDTITSIKCIADTTISYDNNTTILNKGDDISHLFYYTYDNYLQGPNIIHERLDAFTYISPDAYQAIKLELINAPYQNTRLAYSVEVMLNRGVKFTLKNQFLKVRGQ